MSRKHSGQIVQQAIRCGIFIWIVAIILTTVSKHIFKNILLIDTPPSPGGDSTTLLFITTAFFAFSFVTIYALSFHIQKKHSTTKALCLSVIAWILGGLIPQLVIATNFIYRPFNFWYLSIQSLIIFLLCGAIIGLTFRERLHPHHKIHKYIHRRRPADDEEYDDEDDEEYDDEEYDDEEYEEEDR